MKVERILFPTDFSEGSGQALNSAVDLAKHYNARLTILHVIYDIGKSYQSHVPHISMDEIHKEMDTWAMKELDNCCIEETRGLANVDKTVLLGVPYEEIIKGGVST